MSRARRIGAGSLATAFVAAGLTLGAAAPANAGATCSSPVWEEAQKNAAQTCEITNAPVEIMYTWSCGFGGFEKQTTNRVWQASSTALLRSPCTTGSPWSIDFEIRS